MALSEDEFSRLPPEVQKETRELEHRQRMAAIEYDLRIKSRRWSAALIGAAGLIVATLPATFFSDMHAGFFALILLAGGISAWLSVHLRYGFMGGLLLVGCAGVGANVIGFAMGLCAPLLILWPFYIGVGAFVGLWTQGRRHSQDGGF